MKRYIYFVLLFLSYFPAAFAEKNESDLVLIKKWTNQGFGDETGSLVPMLIDEENKLYKVDPDDHILRISDSKLNEINQIKAPFTFPGASITWSGFGGIFYYRSGTVYILRTNGNICTIQINIDSIGDGHILAKDLLIIEDDHGYINGYLLDPVKNEVNQTMDNETLRKYLLENAEKYSILSFDQDGILLFNNCPWSRTGFQKYWKAQQGYFDAIDKDSNTYASRTIKNLFGKTIETLNSNSGTISNFTLDNEGNIFVVRGYKTYYLGRDWGYKNTRVGKLNDSRVRLRLHPGTNELILASVDKGTDVTIFEEAKKEKINGKESPWLKVKLPSGIVGWMFGAFIDY